MCRAQRAWHGMVWRGRGRGRVASKQRYYWVKWQRASYLCGACCLWEGRKEGGGE